MRSQSSTASARDVSVPATMADSVVPGFGDRWAAWEAKDAAHNRAFRQKLAFAAPILAVLTAILLYFLAIR